MDNTEALIFCLVQIWLKSSEEHINYGMFTNIVIVALKLILLLQLIVKLSKIFAMTCITLSVKVWKQIFRNDYYGF